MEICTVCNLEDVRTQFEYESRCDCQCVVHRRCPEMASPYSEHSEFCPLCTAYLPLEQLRARRKWSEESGDFEVESVVDYDRGHNDYIVKWKGYPPAAILKATSFSISHLHQRGTSAPSFSLSLSIWEWVDDGKGVRTNGLLTIKNIQKTKAQNICIHHSGSMTIQSVSTYPVC